MMVFEFTQKQILKQGSHRKGLINARNTCKPRRRIRKEIKGLGGTRMGKSQKLI